MTTETTLQVEYEYGMTEEGAWFMAGFAICVAFAVMFYLKWAKVY